MLIALSIIVVCIEYRKKENSLFYVLIVYLSLIIYSYKHWFYFIYAGNKNSVENTADAALMIDDGNGGCRDFLD